MFDYHGECDIMFIKAPSFGKGIGLDIHVRSTIRNDYSFIESAAIKIGDDILEISAFGQHIFNGVESARFPIEMAGVFPVEYERRDDNTYIFTIFVSEHQHIVIKSFKDFVSVIFDTAATQDYVDSTGILGNFTTYERLARDGVTVMTDDNAYGQEWQLKPEMDGPPLFQTLRAPQHPQEQCRLPAKTLSERRRLGELTVSQEDAEEACASWPVGFQNACVYDVLATGDLEMASAGAF